MVSFSYVIQGFEGLHARPVAQIASAAAGLSSEVTVCCGDTTVVATDLMGLMGLNARTGDMLIIAVEGEHEQEDAEVLKGVFTF